MVTVERFRIEHGDALEVLRGMPDNAVDAIVTDPPAGIAFMGKDWDKDKGGRAAWIGWMSQIAAECLRVLKPGAHALVWSIPRTSHWTATAWEDAGFEVRDRIAHVFGSGFPKSLNLKDAMPSWGTALKPAVEDWWLLRKPLSESSIAANVLRWGTGAVNVDGCRVETTDSGARNHGGKVYENVADGYKRLNKSSYTHKTDWAMPSSGRFPANLIHDGSAQVVEMFPVSDGRNPQGVKVNTKTAYGVNISKNCYGGFTESQTVGYCDTGSAARFFKACPPDDAASLFYCAKASRSERDAGLDGMPESRGGAEQFDSRWKEGTGDARKPMVRNSHPTVKPQSLMRYLCRLICPPNGIILDPFFGSGSTGCAAITEGFSIIGIEQDAEFAEIARRRCEHALNNLQGDSPLFAALSEGAA